MAGMGMIGAIAAVASAAGSVVSAISQNRAQERMRRSLMEEQERANEERKRAQAERDTKKSQLSDLRRSIAVGKKSLMSGWVDDGEGKQTIGA
jgi:3-hydroxyacyl-CoA dehydrogenase